MGLVPYTNQHLARVVLNARALRKGWLMQSGKTKTKATVLGCWLRGALSDRSGAGAAWRSLTGIGLLGGALVLAACGGSSASEADAGENSEGSANGGNGGSGANPGTSAAGGTSSGSAYSECGAGGGGCPASDPICVDESGVVSAVSGAGGARTSVVFEACARPCETDSDCPASAETEARPRCITDGQSNVCALDCADGAECPQGMQCSSNGQLCMYLHFTVWSGNCTTDPDMTLTCKGDCLGQTDVTCTRSCSETEYTCVPNAG